MNFILNAILHLVYHHKQNLDEKFLLNLSENFVNSLNFIDETNNEYKFIFTFGYFYHNRNEKIENFFLENLNSLSNKFMLKFFNSSLNILVFLGKLNEINNFSICQNTVISSITEKLNSNNRDVILLKCVTIPNNNIKRKVLEILISVDYAQIDDDEFTGLINTLNNLNFLEINMDEMIMKTFLFITKLFEYRARNKKRNLSYVDVIDCGIRIAVQNISRDFFRDQITFKNSQNLNLILSTFLINLSGYKELNSHLSLSKHFENFKKLLNIEIEALEKNKENKFNLNNYIIPFYFEKVFNFWKISNIKEFLSSSSIKPYNFIVFRLFRQMGDILMNIPYEIFDIYNLNDKIEVILERIRVDIKEREVAAVSLERSTWEFFKIKIPNEKEDNNEINKEIKRSIILDDQFLDDQKAAFVDNFFFFLDFLAGESRDISIKNQVEKRLIEFKFDQKLMKSELTEEKEEKSIDLGSKRARFYDNIPTVFKEELTIDKSFNFFEEFKNKFFSKSPSIFKNKNISIFKSSDNENIEPKLRLYLNTCDDTFTGYKINLDSYSHIKEDLREEGDTYGTSIDYVYRVLEHETVDNCYLRGLLISSFLRCIFAITKNYQKKKKKYKKETKSLYASRILIGNLRNMNNFNKLILLVDCTKLSEFNINAKILIIIKHIFEKISDNTQTYHINKYEFQRLILLISILIEKTLDNIYFTQKDFSYESNGNSNTYLVEKLVKCCLCIKKEIFKNMSLDSKEKKDLLLKILSTRLLFVLVNHALKIMENDLPTQKINKIEENSEISLDENEDNEKNKTENEIKYNKYLLDLLVMVSEFITCREEVYIIVVEYITKKYYIEKKIIRQTFIKDIGDLRYLSYVIRLMESQKNKDNYKNIESYFFTGIFYVSICKVFFFKNNIESEEEKNKFFCKEEEINEISILIIDQKALIIKRLPYGKDNNINFEDIKNSENIFILKFEKNKIKQIFYNTYGNRIFIRLVNSKNFVISIFFKKSIESYLFFCALKNISKDISFVKLKAPFDNVLERFELENLIDSNNHINKDEGLKIINLIARKKSDEKKSVLITKNKGDSASKILINNKYDINQDKITSKTKQTNLIINNESFINKKPTFILNDDKKTNNNVNPLNESDKDDKVSELKDSKNRRKENKSNNKLDNSYLSPVVEKSLRTKSNIKTIVNLKTLMKNEEIRDEKFENSPIMKTERNITELNEKINSDQKILFSKNSFVCYLDFTAKLNIEELNEINIYDNLYILYLKEDYIIEIYSEDTRKIFSTIRSIQDYSENSMLKNFKNSMNLVQTISLKELNNIYFDNRRITFELTSLKYMFNKSLQIFPLDDRSFFFMRNFFVVFLSKTSRFKHASKNFLNDPLSNRIFKN